MKNLEDLHEGSSFGPGKGVGYAVFRSNIIPNCNNSGWKFHVAIPEERALDAAEIFLNIFGKNDNKMACAFKIASRVEESDKGVAPGKAMVIYLTYNAISENNIGDLLLKMKEFENALVKNGIKPSKSDDAYASIPVKGSLGFLKYTNDRPVWGKGLQFERNEALSKKYKEFYLDDSNYKERPNESKILELEGDRLEYVLNKYETDCYVAEGNQRLYHLKQLSDPFKGKAIVRGDNNKMKLSVSDSDSDSLKNVQHDIANKINVVPEPDNLGKNIENEEKKSPEWLKITDAHKKIVDGETILETLDGPVKVILAKRCIDVQKKELGETLRSYFSPTSRGAQRSVVPKELVDLIGQFKDQLQGSRDDADVFDRETSIDRPDNFSVPKGFNKAEFLANGENMSETDKCSLELLADLLEIANPGKFASEGRGLA